MPASFVKCVQGGGRVRTVKPKADKYIPICYDSKGSHAGEVKTTKKVKGKKK